MKKYLIKFYHLPIGMLVKFQYPISNRHNVILFCPINISDNLKAYVPLIQSTMVTKSNSILNDLRNLGFKENEMKNISADLIK